MKFFARLKRIYWCLTGFFVLLWVAAVASVISLAVGCASIPEEERREIYDYATNAIERVFEKIEEERPTEAADVGGEEASPVTSDDSASAASPAVSPTASVALDFRYGGVNGSKSVEDPNTQIKDLHMSKSGMSYKWAKGSLRNWGITPDTNAGALACAFYWDGKQWVGGKFDHISTSRTTRDFKNINNEHYHGWDPDKFWSAKKRAFCIMSEDGKKRTNLLETTEP